jgi:hypothetical protein
LSVKIKIGDSQFTLTTLLSDIPLYKGILINNIEIPEIIEKIWNNKEVGVLSDSDNKHIDKFIFDVFLLLSDVPEMVLKETDPLSLISIFNEHLLKPFLAIKYLDTTNYSPIGVMDFVHKGVLYSMPKSTFVNDNELLLAKAKVEQVLDAIDVSKSGLAGMGLVTAILTSPVYDEDDIMSRAEAFRDLPVDVVFEVFFCLNNLWIKPMKCLSGFFQEKTKGLTNKLTKEADLQTSDFGQLSLN